MTQISKWSISTCVLALVMGSTTAAAAQDAGAVDEPQSEGIRDIIVTAQRYSESAQSAPVIIDTVTAEELHRISDIRQLSNAVPGIQFANAGNVIQTYVRGIGSFNAKSVQESAVAYSLDGVYLFTTTQVSPAMYDLERVEVLKGPQGTLYGRNASGGAINLISRGASLAEAEGTISAEVGNYGLFRGVGAVNLPVSSSFAIRIAGQHVRHDGYLSDGTSDDNTVSGRIRTLWEPNAALSLKVNFDVARVRGKGPGSIVYPFIDPDNPWVGALDPRSDKGPSTVSGFRPLTTPANRLDQWSTSAELNWNLGLATLTVLPAYRHEKISQVGYVPGYRTTEDANVRQTSIEARLANKSAALRWVVGAYFLNTDIDQTFETSNPTPPVGRPAVNAFYNPNQLKSWAVFGETAINISDPFRLIAGLRYTWERATSGGFQNQTFPGPVATAAYRPGVEPGDFVIAESVTDDAVTWKLGAQYDVAPRSMIFATVSRGFKGGGSYVDAHATNPTFRPEYVTAFEIGSRNRFFDNTLQVNLEGFYWKIHDQQISFLGFNSLNQPKFQTVNAADSKVYGASLDVHWMPTPQDTVRLGVEYAKSQYTNFVRVQPSAPNGTNCPTTVVSAGRVAINCSGFPMMRTPEWAGSAGYEHRFDLANSGIITLGGDLTFASSRWTSIDYSAVTRDGGYVLANAEVSYRSPDERWTLTLWGQNLTKTAYLVGGLQSGTINRPTINQPRTYGMRLRMNF